MTTSNEHNNAPAVPDGLQWFTVAEHGIPEIGAEVIGGLWYTDPWIKTEFATTFMWGQCRVVESKHRDFKDGKQWCTFGPSHNQITHWARINTPGQTSAPAPAVPQTVYLVENRTCLLAYASREDADKAVASMPASTGMHWTENEPVRLPASRAGRVYLAGPMTGLPELNFPAFTQEAERLRDEGLQVLNPADHGIVDGADWADYLRHDITGLASCERIHLLRGWTKSKGACLEMTIAKALGMTVTYQFDAEMEHNNAHAQDQCNACCGTGRMVRDPDIGTDQECFVCDGTGFLPAQEPVTLTPAEIDHAVLEATGFDGFGTQPMNTHDTRNIGLEVIAALRAKGGKHV